MSMLQFSEKNPKSKTVLVTLHGLGDRAENFLRIDFGNFHHFSVQAPLDYHGGFAWYLMDQPLDDQAKDIKKSLKSLEGFLKEKVFPLKKEVVLAGFSQGAVISLKYACTKPKNISAVAAFSGYIFSPETFGISPGAREIPFLIFHGVYDPVIPDFFMSGNRIKKFLEGKVRSVQYREFAIFHEITKPELKVMQDWLKSMWLL